jgi:hypothetical protein
VSVPARNHPHVGHAVFLSHCEAVYARARVHPIILKTTKNLALRACRECARLGAPEWCSNKTAD